MQFIIRRLAFYVVAGWAAITINFVIPHLLPSNPVQAMMARHPEFPPSARRALEIQFGLGHPGSLLHQYFVYLGHLAHGNLGISILNYPASVAQVLNNTVPWTIALVGSATIISFAIGTLLGIFAGWRRGGWFDRALPAFTFVQAIPYFFLAELVLVLFASDLHLFPSYGGYQLGDTIGFVIAGALVMEIVFSYPGVGYQLFQAVTNDDFPVMQGIFLAISGCVLVACLLADVVYVLADPRVRTRAAY